MAAVFHCDATFDKGSSYYGYTNLDCTISRCKFFKCSDINVAEIKAIQFLIDDMSENGRLYDLVKLVDQVEIYTDSTNALSYFLSNQNLYSKVPTNLIFKHIERDSNLANSLVRSNKEI